ncbi:hypothetical protein SBV1_2560009 [Verrucomicrobia bacterium]|nr:hypothetical protein SBV1_2560009 [Verrucomicrobiota bacterium]
MFCSNIFTDLSTAVIQHFMVYTLNSAGQERDTLEAAQRSWSNPFSIYHSLAVWQQPVNRTRGSGSVGGTLTRLLHTWRSRRA